MKILIQISKKLLIAFTLSAAASQASAVALQLVSITGLFPISIDSSTTDDWNWDGTNLSVSYYDATTYGGMAYAVNDYISDLVMTTSGAATATDYGCSSAIFDHYQDHCGGFDSGNNGSYESSIVYNGTGFTRTMRGDDNIISPARSLDAFTYGSHTWDGSTLVFTTNSETAPPQTFTFSAVPIPAAAYLFGSALLGLVGLKRKK